MIFDIVHSNSGRVVLLPVKPNNPWEAYRMLQKAFPPNYQKANPLLDFFVTPHYNYVNGIVFSK